MVIFTDNFVAPPKCRDSRRADSDGGQLSGGRRQILLTKNENLTVALRQTSQHLRGVGLTRDFTQNCGVLFQRQFRNVRRARVPQRYLLQAAVEKPLGDDEPVSGVPQNDLAQNNCRSQSDACGYTGRDIRSVFPAAVVKNSPNE